MKRPLNENVLCELCAMPAADLECLEEVIRSIRELREKVGRLAHSSAPPPFPISEELPPQVAGPPAMPTVKTVRDRVLEVLRAKSPRRRADIISEVATQSGSKVTDAFKSRIGDILNDDENPIRKIGYGIYAFDGGGGR